MADVMIDRELSTKSVHRPLPAVRWIAPWGAVAAALSLAGVFTFERRLLVPLSLLSAVTTVIVGYFKLPRFRAWADALDLRAILGLHALRAPIGAAFLLLEAQGKLSGAFARVAGFGDIAVGLGAVALLATFGARDRRAPSRVLVVWNALGFFDILLVVGQAQRLLLFVDPEGVMALAAFPGSMLPTFVVPLVVTSHLLVFRRAIAAGRLESC